MGKIIFDQLRHSLTIVVDLCLDKGGIVEVGLGSNFEIHLTGWPLGVVGSTSTGLNVGIHTVIVASRVEAQVS